MHYHVAYSFWRPIWGCHLISHMMDILLLENSEVCNWLFLLIPNSPVFFFLFVEAAKELKMERKKTGIPLNLIFIHKVYDYLVVRNVFLNPAKAFEEYHRIIFGRWRVYHVCLQLVYSAAAVRGITKRVLQLVKRCVHFNWGFWTQVSFWRKDSLLFRHVQIVLPVRAPLGIVIFVFIYLILCLFYFYMLLHISYSIPTSIKNWHWFV